MSDPTAVQEKSSDAQSIPVSSLLGWISAGLALVLILCGIALCRAYKLQITPSMWPLLVAFGVTALVMAFQAKWRPRAESLLNDKPRAWIWLGIILFLIYPGQFLYYFLPFHLNFGLYSNLLLIAIFAEVVHQKTSAISSVIALIIGLMVTIGFFYTERDVVSGFILLILLVGSIFGAKEGRRLLPVRYRIIPILYLGFYFMCGLRQHQYRRLLEMFSTNTTKDMYGFAIWHDKFQKAFELGGPWGAMDLGTDMS